MNVLKDVTVESLGSMTLEEFEDLKKRALKDPAFQRQMAAGDALREFIADMHVRYGAANTLSSLFAIVFQILSRSEEARAAFELVGHQQARLDDLRKAKEAT